MNTEIDISNVTLHTDRMILRPWRQTDLDDLYAYASVDGVGQMAGWKPHESKEESQKILDMFIGHKKTFALEYQGKVIGSLGIEQYNEDHFPEFADKKCREIGYVLSKEYWGQGLMPEAVKEVIRHLFEVVGLDVIFCGHFLWNKQSQRVQEKCGFKHYAFDTYETKVDTTEEDEVNILTREDWQAESVVIRDYAAFDFNEIMNLYSWTGYRYYDEDQALQYVKIKNLQMAGFSIDEIRGLLDADNDTIFKAFSAKIKEQEDRLQKTREIRQSYLSEVQRMKEKVKEFRETVLSLMEDYDPTEEFGITADEYREIVDSLTTYLDTHEFTEGDFDYDLSDDGDAAREEPEYLNVLNNPDFEVIYEQHGWEHAREVIGKFTVPDDGKEYMLLFTISKDKENPTAFANTALSVMLGANLKSRERTCQNSQKLGCNVTVSEDGQNHFWLLKRK